MRPHVLIVEDDPAIAEMIALYLEMDHYELAHAGDGEQALRLFAQRQPNLVVLDLWLPRLSGWEVCRRIRSDSSVPILMVTAQGEPSQRVAGLDLGADDYLGKPFDPEELRARIRALLRRTGQLAPERLQQGELMVDLSRYEASRRGESLGLAPKEVELLYAFLRRPGHAYSRGQMLNMVWGEETAVEERVVDVYVKRLRQKLVQSGLEGGLIETVWGVGYRWAQKAPSPS